MAATPEVRHRAVRNYVQISKLQYSHLYTIGWHYATPPQKSYCTVHEPTGVYTTTRPGGQNQKFSFFQKETNNKQNQTTVQCRIQDGRHSGRSRRKCAIERKNVNTRVYSHRSDATRRDERPIGGGLRKKLSPGSSARSTRRHRGGRRQATARPPTPLTQRHSAARTIEVDRGEAHRCTPPVMRATTTGNTYPRAQPVTMTRLPLAGSGATRRVERITKTTHKL